MAEKVKNFIQKKKLDYKFSQAGSGHRLDEEKKLPTVSAKQESTKSRHEQASAASHSAGDAALSRLQHQQQQPKVKSVTPTMKTQLSSSQPSTSTKGATHDAVTTVDSRGQDKAVSVVVQDGVCVVCALCNNSVSYAASKDHTELCLQEEYLKEPLTASCLMIHTLTTNEDVRKTCIDTLTRYLDNIINNPGEEKYLKIRINNKAFQERVLGVRGADLFLEAIGFHQKLLPHQDGEEQFYVLDKEMASDVEACKELLLSSSPLKSKLDRSPQVFQFIAQVNHFSLPQEFYNLSIDEIKREQKLKSEALEKETVLRTKVMRERDEIRSAVRYYKFVLLRVRLPNQLVLQGVFKPLETISVVREFITSCLVDPTCLYNLVFHGGPLNNDGDSLAMLGLVPSAVLNLSWHNISTEIIPSLMDNLKPL